MKELETQHQKDLSKLESEMRRKFTVSDISQHPDYPKLVEFYENRTRGIVSRIIEQQANTEAQLKSQISAALAQIAKLKSKVHAPCPPPRECPACPSPVLKCPPVPPCPECPRPRSSSSEPTAFNNYQLAGYV
jgi:hypothetical protein